MHPLMAGRLREFLQWQKEEQKNMGGRTKHPNTCGKQAPGHCPFPAQALHHDFVRLRKKIAPFSLPSPKLLHFITIYFSFHVPKS